MDKNTATTNMSIDETLRLRINLESLPQGLYDHIYDLTFTAKPGVHDIENRGEMFMAPDTRNLLQVDRASRQQFAASYYGGEGSIFVLSYASGTKGAWKVWLEMLQVEHRNSIRELRVAGCTREQLQKGLQLGPNWFNRHARRFREAAKFMFGEQHVNCLKFGYWDDTVVRGWVEKQIT